MSVEENKAIVRRYFEQVVNKVDRAAAEELVAADVVFNSPYTPQPTHDRESFLGMLDAVHAAFPDFSLVDHEMVAERDLIASRWTVYGTHQDELGGAPPTGKRLAISGLSIYRIANGKIVEGWVQDDTFQLLSQAVAASQAEAAAATA
ncbi:MAG: ester cyclase [Chloroflexi bacterium]|nr:ester cyclase [Chloroflexota bacterium]